MMLKPGIYPDMDEAAYYADPAPGPSLTQSIAKVLIERSPAHARLEHPRLCPPGETEPESYSAAKAIGSAAHRMMTGRGREVYVAPFDDWRTKEAKAQRDAAIAAGQIPILEKHGERAVSMVRSACSALLKAGIETAFRADTGSGEVCLLWQEDDLWFRSLVDWMPTDLLIPHDYKTTEMSVAPHGLSRMMINAGWDIQAAMQERGLAVLDPKNAGRRKFRFVVQEQDPPFALVVCELPESVLTLGRKKLDYAVNLWRACLKADVWPAYPPEVFYPEYPAYAETAWLNREVENAARPTNILLAG